MTSTAKAALGDLVLTSTDLAKRLAEADAVQWSASPRPRPREDTTERSKGGPPSDPTADVALDGRRLSLRAAVLTAEHSLGDAVDAVAAANKGLERALDEWHRAGERP
ncbi:hypothetical protein [Cellulosimicrobium sp. TH-20]|uniref:DUF7169 domain-containing protein n=1 Tax=Cellulosimicrobium sp. TH-20 TaxID=1980001 RepID=UPI0011A4BF32|nr:hypothetical protein [Cellulosimicrobium sp. TH-20]